MISDLLCLTLLKEISIMNLLSELFCCYKSSVNTDAHLLGPVPAEPSNCNACVAPKQAAVPDATDHSLMYKVIPLIGVIAVNVLSKMIDDVIPSSF
jgi:hypothetical protein